MIIQSNEQQKKLDQLLHSKGTNLPAETHLEPLFPSSIALRQARLGPMDRKLFCSDSESVALSHQTWLPEPNIWYVSQRPVPDRYFDKLSHSNLPYVLVLNTPKDDERLNELCQLLATVASKKMNILISADSPSINARRNSTTRWYSAMRATKVEVQQTSVDFIANAADRLALIAHAEQVIGSSLIDVVDAIVLNRPCQWAGLEKTEFPISAETAQQALQNYAYQRLQHHILIETVADLELASATFFASAYSCDSAGQGSSQTSGQNCNQNSDQTQNKHSNQTNNQPNWLDASPVMALPELKPSRTRKQNFSTWASASSRKFKKFRESPRRFFADAKWWP